MVLPYQQIHTFADFGFFQLSAWGTMVALGFLIGLLFISNEAKKREFDLDTVYELALAILIGGIVGARLGWIITEGWGTGFLESFKIWNGGMIWNGGFIGAFFAFYAYSKWKKLDLPKHADLLAVGIPLGHAIGRIGCHIIGDHLGKQTLVPWGITLGGGITHPISLYEVIALLGIWSYVFKTRNKKRFDGALFSIYIMSYSFFRFFKDFLGLDPTYFGLTVAQYLSIIFFTGFGAFYYIKSKNKI